MLFHIAKAMYWTCCSAAVFLVGVAVSSPVSRGHDKLAYATIYAALAVATWLPGGAIYNIAFGKRRALRIASAVYLTVATLLAGVLLWNALSSGALERSHSHYDWLVAMCAYQLFIGLWPLLPGLFVLQSFGIIRSPITFPVLF